MPVKKVICTSETGALIKFLAEKHGALVFHQSGGCCDGSAPMLFQEDEFYIDENDVLLGHIESVPFYISADQYEYWKYSQLIIDISKGRGSSFSLESPTGKRFVTKSRLFNEAELAQLQLA